MEVLFGDPFYNHISNYLSPPTLYKLCQTCKTYQSIITKPFFERASIKIIRKKLLSIHNSEGKVLDFLNDLTPSGIITGDKILSCILDLHSSDPFECYYPNTFEFSDKLAIYRTRACDMRFSDYAECRIFFTLAITHAIVKSQNVRDFIACYFHQDFCRNIYWYDGKQDHIEVNSFNQILSKRVLAKDTMAMNKYKKMGFSFQ